MATFNTERRIQDDSYMIKFFEKLQSLRQSEEFCDLTIKVAEEKFRVHKIVLVLSSEYFKNMFTKENDKNYVELLQVDPKAFRSILDYWYSGHAVLSENTVERVLTAAETLFLAGVRSASLKYRSNNIRVNTENIIAKHSITEHQTKSFLVGDHEGSKRSHFDKIAAEIHNETNTTSEPDGNADQILIRQHNARSCSHCLVDISSETNLFLTCQYSAKSKCLQLHKDALKPLSARPNIKNFSAVSYKKSIYITAGEYGRRILKKSYKYDADENSWSEMNLNFNRDSASACILNDKLFIVGGHNYLRRGFLNSCISYDFNSNQKFKLRNMKKKRCKPGISVYQNSIYVCNGWNGLEDLSCIERYDPREGLWKNVGECKFVAGGCSAAIICDFLYASSRERPIVKRFDLRNNSSEELEKPVTGAKNANWITSSKGKLLRIYDTGLSEYVDNYNQWVNRKQNFNLTYPIVVPWD